jgi:hypothetical protein
MKEIQIRCELQLQELIRMRTDFKCERKYLDL